MEREAARDYIALPIHTPWVCGWVELYSSVVERCVRVGQAGYTCGYNIVEGCVKESYTARVVKGCVDGESCRWGKGGTASGWGELAIECMGDYRAHGVDGESYSSGG